MLVSAKVIWKCSHVAAWIKFHLLHEVYAVSSWLR